VLACAGVILLVSVSSLTTPLPCRGNVPGRPLIDALLFLRPPHQFKMESVAADIETVPVWCNYDDLFLDMSGLKVSPTRTPRVRLCFVIAALEWCAG
jgi:hypothetical protein